MRFFSASAINTFLTCPLAYRYIYVDGATRMPGNIYMDFGSAVHAALDFNMRQKINTKKDLPHKEIVSFFSKDFAERIAKLPRQGFFKADPRTMLAQGQELVAQFMIQIAPELQPIATEQYFEIPFETYPFGIKGYIDLITVDGQVIDYKSAGTSTFRTWTQKYVDNMIQLKIYSLAYRKMYGKPEDCSRIDVLGRLVGGPKFKTLKTKSKDYELMALIQLMYRMNEMIEEDKFFPNMQNCSECDFKNSCQRLCIFNPK